MPNLLIMELNRNINVYKQIYNYLVAGMSVVKEGGVGGLGSEQQPPIFQGFQFPSHTLELGFEHLWIQKIKAVIAYFPASLFIVQHFHLVNEAKPIYFTQAVLFHVREVGIIQKRENGFFQEDEFHPQTLERRLSIEVQTQVGGGDLWKSSLSFILHFFSSSLHFSYSHISASNAMFSYVQQSYTKDCSFLYFLLIFSYYPTTCLLETQELIVQTFSLFYLFSHLLVI